ncbi:SMAD/FHA domain-containing protein, partial [Phellopilus nigrolimitatus]
MPAQPPSPTSNPNPGHRRRPAAGGIQASASHGFNTPSANTGVVVPGLSHILRRRRSANGVLNTNGATNPSIAANPSPVDASQPALAARPATSAVPVLGAGRSHRIRLVPHLDSNRSLHFEPISRDVREGDSPLRIGRFTDRSGMGVAALNAQNTNKLAFKSKVVSRAHAEVWCETGGSFFIKDTKSSSGTFLNHIRLSAPNTDSRRFPLKDGDVLQLGVDYQGGTEEIYKCVKMRIELGREWQAQANAFNTNALKQLKALSSQPSSGKPASKGAISKSGISDCCICLFSVTVHQSLFIAPCSHVFHYKCIRPMLLMHHPGFSCPLCRTFANLEEDVE